MIKKQQQKLRSKSQEKVKPKTNIRMSAFCGLYWPSMHPTGSNSSEHFYIILFFSFCSRNRIAPPSMFIYFDNLMKRIHAPVLRIIRNQCDEFDMSCAVKRKSIQMCIGCYFYFSFYFYIHFHSV